MPPRNIVRTRPTQPLGPTLPPRKHDWPQVAALFALVAAAGAAGGFHFAAPMLVAGGAVSALVAALVFRQGLITNAHHELHDTIVVALYKPLGRQRPSRSDVTLGRWTRGRSGRPRKIRLSYDPAVDVDHLDWRAQVAGTLSRLLDAHVEFVSVNHRRCIARFEETVDPELEDEQKPREQIRASSIVREMLGAGARTIDVDFDNEDQLARFTVEHQVGTRASKPPFRNLVERTVTTMMTGRWRAEWDLEGDIVTFIKRPVAPSYVPHEPRDLAEPTVDPKFLPYGLDEDGEPVGWSLKSSAGQPHFLVTGATGTGKTVLINGLVMEACRRNWRVRICDPKRIEFVGLREWPNVEIVATDVESMVAVIESTYQEMNRRYSLIESGQADEDDFEPLVLVLDEYRYFTGVVNGWYTSGKKPPKGSSKCPILERVFLIASLGRSAAVHLIMGTQRPDAEWLGGDTRDQFNARASLGRLSPDGARMMWGSGNVGVSLPRKVPGRCIGVNSDGVPAEAQVYWTPDPRRHAGKEGTDRELLEALRPPAAKHQPLVVVPPKLDYDSTQLFYDDFAAAALEPVEDHPDLVTPLGARVSTASTASPSDLPAHPVPEAVSPSEAGSDGYSDPRERKASTLLAGDLLLVDESTEQWAVVEEDASEDFENEGSVCIPWRDDYDEQGVLILEGDEQVTARSPEEE